MFCPFGPLPLTQSLIFHFPLLPNIPPYFPKFPQEFRSPLSPSFRFISTKSLVSHIGISFTQKMFQRNKRLILENWERFLSKTCQGRKPSFNFYTGVMVLEKCQKYRCLKRIDAPPGSSVGRFDFLQGKWAPNWEMPLGLDSRHPGISNKISWAWFSLHEVLQK